MVQLCVYITYTVCKYQALVAIVMTCQQSRRPAEREGGGSTYTWSAIISLFSLSLSLFLYLCLFLFLILVLSVSLALSAPSSSLPASLIFLCNKCK